MPEDGFILIPDKTLNRIDLTPTQKLLIGQLARMQGANAHCYPSLQYLGDAIGMSRVQVQRSLADLVERGEVIAVKMPYRSSRYSVPWATARALRRAWAVRRKGA